MSKTKKIPEGMVVSSRQPRWSFMSGLRKPQKPVEWALVVAASVLLLVAGTALIASYISDDPPIKKAIDSELPTDYSVMTPAEIAERLKYDTGLDIAKLEKEDFNSRTFKNFDAAYATAQAFYGLKSYDKSLAAYEIAADKVGDDVDYQFYIRYAAVAEIKNDVELSAKLQDQAKQAVNADTSLSEQNKKDIIEELELKKRLRELEQ